MLIDEFLPEYDFSERHETRVRASRERVFDALNSSDLTDSWIIWTLFALRGLGWSRAAKKTTLRDMTASGFAVLGEKPNDEILLGLAGKFWTPTGKLQKIDAGNFRQFDEKGFAKAVWNFSLAETAGATRLTTETRIRCTDAESRRSFGFYWAFIQPFSGLIRSEMLKIVRKKAEGENKEGENK